MFHKNISSVVAVSFVQISCLGVPVAANAEGFFEDSHAQLDLRNFYMNRDYRNDNLPDVPRHKGKAQSKSEDWGQGFLLRLNSGFTATPIGFGLDALGLYGVKLDSGAGTGGTGVLQRNPVSGKSESNYGFLGITAKAKFANTVGTVGNHEPLLPVIYRNDTRMLPSTYEGFQLVSKDFDKLTLTAGQFDKVHLRDSSDTQDMVMYSIGSTGGVESDQFQYAGASYALTPSSALTYFRAELRDNYQQDYLGYTRGFNLSEGYSLKADLRAFKSDSEGATNVDNFYYGAFLTVTNLNHALGFGYQDQSGRTGMPFLVGTDAYIVNMSNYATFLRPEERSFQVRYDYNFAPIGIPGLTFMGRYISGSQFEVRGESAREWERDLEVAYVIQSGFAKDFAVRWKNIMYRGDHATGLNENRLILSYVFKFK